MSQQHLAIFQTITQLIENDYAGQPECAKRDTARQVGVQLAEAESVGKLDDRLFVENVSAYLRAFKDPNLMLKVSGNQVLKQEKFLENLRPPTFETRTKSDEITAIITVYQFIDSSVLTLLQKNLEDLQRASRVIIDLRGANEGMIGNAHGLMAMFFDREINLQDIMGQSIVYTRYSPLNAHLRQRQLARLLELSDDAGKQGVQAEIDHVAACSGKGFVKEAEYEEAMLFPPSPTNQRVFLLIDKDTGGPAERLVSFAKQAVQAGCSEVCCVGEPTCGGIDYANLISVAFDENFSLVYPMSKTQAAHEGKGFIGRGIAPDVAVASSASDAAHDAVLEKALSL